MIKVAITDTESKVEPKWQSLHLHYSPCGFVDAVRQQLLVPIQNPNEPSDASVLTAPDHQAVQTQVRPVCRRDYSNALPFQGR